ncbi:hypothetical protein TRAPUB_4075 [Trametes pubescens]|uniref:DUF6533 domain-containing protein n=1 Tax=Trametes pubescens TaxID=154538 RepID=A0A1M2VC24_TRAPU|nr:hypothetical protein TRAPUB_4075 [Trametes pubescens]
MPEEDPLAHLWPVLRDADASFFISCAATTLALYEHLITIRLEVQQVWKRDASGATVLFIMTRYFMLLSRIFVILGFYPIRDPAAIATSALIIVLSGQFAPGLPRCWLYAKSDDDAAIGAIRVYALWNRDYRLLIILMLTGIIPAMANLFFRSASSAYIVPTRFYSCQSAPTAMTAQTYKALSIATRVISIFSDGLVVFLTWKKTFRIYALTRHAKLHADYSVLILRDGHEPPERPHRNVRTFPPAPRLPPLNYNPTILHRLSAILMARFLLNLRDQRAHLEDKAWPGDSSPSTLTLAFSASPSTIRFRPGGVLDTMGGTISMGSREAEDLEGDGSDEETRCECEYAKKALDEESVWA